MREPQGELHFLRSPSFLSRCLLLSPATPSHSLLLLLFLLSPHDKNYFCREGTAGRTSLSPLSFFSLSLYFFPSLPFSLASNCPPLLLLLLPSLLSLFSPRPKFLFSLCLARRISLLLHDGFLSLSCISCTTRILLAFCFSLPNRRASSPPPLSLALALVLASFERKPSLMREEREKRWESWGHLT